MESKRNTEKLVHHICRKYLEEHSDQELDAGLFESLYDDVRPLLLQGKRIELAPPNPADTEQMFGIDMDPSAEAILLGVAANISYDIAKKGFARVKQLLSNPRFVASLRNSIRVSSRKGKDTAASIIKWISENLDELDREQ